MKAQRPNYEVISTATNFFRRFGFGPMSIEKFDIWIIDNKLAEDPGTDNPKHAHYKAFVTDRAKAKTLINRGGVFCDDAAFMVDVIRPGIEYEVKPWAERSIEQATEMGEAVAQEALRLANRARKQEAQAEYLLSEDPTNTKLQEAVQMMSAMRGHGVIYQNRVKALSHQFNQAADFTVDRVALLLAEYSADNYLGHDDTETEED